MACGRRRDGASWLAWMSIRSGRYVPSFENPPGQPFALECPERPGGGVGPAAEFVRQFCFRRQLGPRRVFAAPDPPHEHGVNVRVGLRALPRIIQTNHTGSVTALAPAGSLCSIWNIRAWPRQRMGLRAGDDLARSAACAGVLGTDMRCINIQTVEPTATLPRVADMVKVSLITAR
jgi:hypothetical protein